MSRLLDDQTLLRLLDQVWNPADPLLIGLKDGRVRKCRATYGLSFGLIKDGLVHPLSVTPPFKEHTTSYVIYPRGVNSFHFIYGARRLHTGISFSPINYLLGNWGKASADELDIAIAMQESYILLRNYMWTPRVKQHKTYKTGW